MCPISAVFGVRSITIHSPRRTRALCWSRSRADILWYRVQMGAHEWSWKDFSLTSTWSPKIAQKFRGATTLVADWDLRNSTLASKACFGPYPLINAKLIRFGPLWNENPFFFFIFHEKSKLSRQTIPQPKKSNKLYPTEYWRIMESMHPWLSYSVKSSTTHWEHVTSLFLGYMMMLAKKTKIYGRSISCSANLKQDSSINHECTEDNEQLLIQRIHLGC